MYNKLLDICVIKSFFVLVGCSKYRYCNIPNRRASKSKQQLGRLQCCTRCCCLVCRSVSVSSFYSVILRFLDLFFTAWENRHVALVHVKSVNCVFHGQCVRVGSNMHIFSVPSAFRAESFVHSLNFTYTTVHLVFDSNSHSELIWTVVSHLLDRVKITCCQQQLKSGRLLTSLGLQIKMEIPVTKEVKFVDLIAAY